MISSTYMIQVDNNFVNMVMKIIEERFFYHSSFLTSSSLLISPTFLIQYHHHHHHSNVKNGNSNLEMDFFMIRSHIMQHASPMILGSAMFYFLRKRGKKNTRQEAHNQWKRRNDMIFEMSDFLLSNHFQQIVWKCSLKKTR